jgi:hypothetical protein
MKRPSGHDRACEDVGQSIAAIESLSWTIFIEQLPGLRTGPVERYALRAGDNKHVIVCRSEVETEVTVGRDAQAVAADPRARFGTALTREQIVALSDDSAEMAQQLAIWQDRMHHPCSTVSKVGSCPSRKSSRYTHA